MPEPYKFHPIELTREWDNVLTFLLHSHSGGSLASRTVHLDSPSYVHALVRVRRPVYHATITFLKLQSLTPPSRPLRRNPPIGRW